MRFVCLAAAAVVMAAGATPSAAEPARPSQAACDTAKLGGGDLAACLRAAADKTDKALTATFDAALKSIDARQGVLSSQKARWHRSLNEAQALWIGWRDSECQDVAPFEGGMAAKGGDPTAQLHHRRQFRPHRQPEGALPVTSLEGLGYAHDPLDRATAVRDDPAALAALRARADARVVVVARDMPMLRKGEAALEPLLPLSEVEALGGARVEALLGLLPGGAPVFAALLPDEAVIEQADASDGFLDRRVLVVPGRDDLEMVDIRSLAAGGLVPAPEASILAAAKALLAWHARRSFCSNCGAKTHVGAAGWRRECPNCRMQHFPRTDPVVIMLAVDGDSCLLGRQPRFPKGMYSALAGFLEPGETIEQAVRREIMEEFGIVCGEVRYFASQPWPFPSSLMIGCFAQAESRMITVDRTELEDARWFEREEVRADAREAPPGQGRRAVSDGDRAPPDQGLGGGRPTVLEQFSIKPRRPRHCERSEAIQGPPLPYDLWIASSLRFSQ